MIKLLAHPPTHTQLNHLSLSLFYLKMLQIENRPNPSSIFMNDTFLVASAKY